MPALLIDRLLNVATPLTAAMVAVPLSVPLPGLVPIATVTLELLLVTRLPNASSTDTCTAGLMVTPATELRGSEVNTICLAAPGVMLNADDVPLVRLPSVAVRVYPVPALLMERLLNVAIPLTAATVAVPLSAPLAGLVPIATVTFDVSVVTTLPNASSTAA